MPTKDLISYGGILKEIHKELNLDDSEEGDLLDIDDNSNEVVNGAIKVMAYWRVVHLWLMKFDFVLE